MKIICLGKTYPQNGAPAPTEPTIFLKPDSSPLHKGNPFFLPEFSSRITAEAELAVRICRLGKYIDARFAHKYYDALTTALDFTAQDLYDRLSAQGQPIDIAKGFDGSVALGHWIEKTDNPAATHTFALHRNGQPAMSGDSARLHWDIDRLIATVSRYYTLKIGDVLLTGSPATAFEIAAEDHLTGYLDDREVLSVRIK